MWLVEGAEGFLSHFVASDRLTAKLAEVLSPPLNTDDNMVRKSISEIDLPVMPT